MKRALKYLAGLVPTYCSICGWWMEPHSHN